MNAYGLVLTVLVMIAIAVAILLFERKRAKQIEYDVREQARSQGREPGTNRR